MESGRFPGLWKLIAGIGLATAIAEIFEFFDTSLADFLCASPNPYIRVVGEVLRWIGAFGKLAPILFVLFMTMSLYALIIEVPRVIADIKGEMRALKASNDQSIERLERAIRDGRVEVVNEFVRQMKQGARFVDVGHELQIQALYRDADYICAYYPVHNILRDNAGLRRVLAETMARPSFRTYEMVVGQWGHRHLQETFAGWCVRINEFRKIGEFSEMKREMNDMSTFISKIRVRFDKNFNERKAYSCEQPREAAGRGAALDTDPSIKLSFFCVALPDGMRRRGVIYIWAKPFGFGFERLEGALILEGESGHLSALWGMFCERWTAIGESNDITEELTAPFHKFLHSAERAIPPQPEE